MSAKIVVVFNQKGGCAKTMTTMQLAGTWGRMGLRVFVVDMDPQNTAKLWELQASSDQPFSADVESFAPLKKHFVDKLEPLLEKFDVILIDCPPSAESDVPWTALLIADYAIIPVIPVMDNVWASKIAEELVLKARAERSAADGPLQAAYLLSMNRKGKVFDVCLEALKKDIQLPILKSRIGMRNAYPECQLYGCTVGDFAESTASKEVEMAATEIGKQIGLKFTKQKGSKHE
ncbi:AAA family ATPase [Rugamonas sp. A1-17]|nr:AAA family ATPase [Rugamonas sp. A1-17]